MKIRHLLWLCILLIFSACSVPDKSLSTQRVRPTAEPGTPTVAPSLATQTPTIQTTKPQMTTTATTDPAQFPNLLNLTMVDAQTGWAYSEEAHRLFRTQDGGITWADITPQGESSVANPAFFNAHQAMVTSVMDPQAPDGQLYQTTDGGEHWTAVGAHIPAERVSFSDPEHGWGEHDTAYGASNRYMQLYQTIDGGQTWQHLKINDPKGGHETFSPPYPPETIHITSGEGFTFQNQNSLWFGGGGVTSEQSAIVWGSRDRGQSWFSFHLPLPGLPAQSSSLVWLHLPVFLNTNEGYFNAIYSPNDTFSQYRMSTYITQDGGRSWVTQPGVLETLEDPMVQPDFVSLTEAFLPCKDGLCVTLDGAKTWQVIQTNIPFRRPENLTVLTFDFVDRHTGWAILAAGKGTSLYQTVDGGQTWTDLHPTGHSRSTGSTPVGSAAASANHIQAVAQWGKGVISQVDYSPDGSRLGVATTVGVSIYDANLLKQLDFIPNGGSGLRAAFAPDWSMLALGNGSIVRLLRIGDQSEVLHFEIQPGHVVRLLFSPDGQYLACLVRPPGEEVYTWNMELRRVADGQLLGSWEAGVMPEVAFSADSQRFYAWNPFFMANLRGWQLPSGRPVDIPNGPSLGGLAFSPDGQWVAEIELGDPSTILLKRNGQDGPAHRLTGANLGQGAMRFTQDGSLLIVSSYANPLQVWRTADGTLLKTIEVGNGERTFLGISPDGQRVVLSAWDGLNFYRLADGKLDRHLGSHFNPMRQVVLSPNGDRAAALIQGQGAQSSLVVWQIPDGQIVYQREFVPALSLAWSPDGEHLALGEWGGRIQVLRAADGQEVLTWPTQTEQVQSLAYSPDGSILASSSMSAVDIWQAQDGKLVRRLNVPGGWADSLRFSRKGERLAVLTGDGSVRVWQSPDSPEDDWQGLGQFASSNYGNENILDFMPDGQSLVIGEPSMPALPSRIWLWRVGDQKSIPNILLPEGILTALRLSPDGAILACGLDNGTIQLWQIPEGKRLRVLAGGFGGIASLDFSSDGQVLVSASVDGTVQIWKVQ